MFDISKDNLLKDFIKFPKKNLLIILLLLGFGEWFVSDLIHFAGGSIGFLALCFGGYFYLKNDKPKFNEPINLDGGIYLCNEDLFFFGNLMKSLKRLSLLISNTMLYFSNFILMQVVNEKSEII